MNAAFELEVSKNERFSERDAWTRGLLRSLELTDLFRARALRIICQLWRCFFFAHFWVCSSPVPENGHSCLRTARLHPRLKLDRYKMSCRLYYIGSCRAELNPMSTNNMHLNSARALISH